MRDFNKENPATYKFFAEAFMITASIGERCPAAILALITNLLVFIDESTLLKNLVQLLVDNMSEEDEKRIINLCPEFMENMAEITDQLGISLTPSRNIIDSINEV